MLALTASGPSRRELAINGIKWLWAHFPRRTHTLQFIKKGSSKICHYTTPADACKAALTYNEKGYNVYFMVNEGDGQGREQDCVTSLTHCFIDTDGCPLDTVQSYLEGIGIEPSYILCSSEGRYHIYFELEQKIQVTPQAVADWQAVQAMFHRLGDENAKPGSLGLDGTMTDYAKLLRVPGFMHIDKSHFCFLHVEGGPTHSLMNLFDATDGERWAATQGDADGFAVSDGEGQRLLEGDELIPAGSRWQALQTVTMYLANREDLSRKAKARMYGNFVEFRLDNEDEVYFSNGELTPKAKGLFNSAHGKKQREVELPVQSAEPFGHADGPQVPVTPPRETWHLPDSFYLGAPNGFGDVVKQVMDYSMYPCAALAFGTFLSALSILKARSTFTPGGSSPALYILNVAIAGYGKGDPFALLQNMFHHAGIAGLIDNELRSDRGVYEHLKDNNGTGMLLIDEIAPVLKAIQSEKAPTHQAYIQKALLSLYSAGAIKGVSFGKTAAAGKGKKEPVIVLDNPMLAMCAYTVPSEFNSLFTLDSVSKGLFQRFIPIVPVVERVPKNLKADKHAIVRSPLFDDLVVPQPEVGPDEDAPPLMAIVRSKARYTKGAQRVFEKWDSDYRDKLISTAQDPLLAHTSGLYSRLGEQIERVATTLAPASGIIDEATLRYAHEFIESRHQATLACAATTVLRGVGSESMDKEDRLLEVLRRLSQQQRTKLVPKRDLFNGVRRYFRNSREFDQALLDAEGAGKIAVGTRKGDKQGRPKFYIKLLG